MSKPFWKKSFYCGTEDECRNRYQCRVCRYLQLQDDFRTIALPSGSTYTRDPIVEIFMEKILPLEEKPDEQ